MWQIMGKIFALYLRQKSNVFVRRSSGTAQVPETKICPRRLGQQLLRTDPGRNENIAYNDHITLHTQK